MITDQNIGWLRKKKVFSIFDLNGVDEDGVSGIMQGGKSTGVTQLEIGTSGIMGMDMTAGEFITGFIPIPYDFNPSYPIGFTVLWTGDANIAGASTASWILQVDLKAIGIAIVEGATALDTPIALADAYVDSAGVASNTDWLLQRTSRGIWSGHTITRNNVENGGIITLELEMDAEANMDNTVFIGLEMDYSPQRCVGQGGSYEAPLLASQI